MKRTLTVWMLVVCLFAVLAVPAFATENEVLSEAPPAETEQEQTEQETEEEEGQDTEPVIPEVATLEELQAAIAIAEDGDIIAVTGTVVLYGQTLSTDKDITIIRHEDFETMPLFILYDESVIDGFNFVDTFGSGNTVIISTLLDTGMAYISNCTFSGDKTKLKSNIKVGNSNVTISDSAFSDTMWIFVESSPGSKSIFNNCILSGGHNGAISVIKGYAEFNHCTITGNASYSGGAIRSTSGEIVINNCLIKDNNVHGSDIGLDIYSLQGGVLTIEGIEEEGSGYYDRLTEQKMKLPLTEYANDVILIYLQDEVATEIFAPASKPDDNIDSPEDNDNPTTDNNNPEEMPPKEEEDNNNTPNGEETPTTPPTAPETPSEQPPKEEGNDTPNDEEPPVEPPAAPETPSDGADDDGEDYIPPISHWPVQRPQRPIVSDPPETEPEDEAEPEPEQAPVEPETDPLPALVCGNAVIDCSRSVKLHGYGDGLLHETDLLTRAQLATIIYRLLDDESIAALRTPSSSFEDVDTEAWHAPYVLALADAGVICGTGGGQYEPDGLATWAHLLTILGRFVEPQEYALQHIQYDGWARQSIETAVALGWIEDNAQIVPDAVITRGEAVVLINAVLEHYR